MSQWIIIEVLAECEQIDRRRQKTVVSRRRSEIKSCADGFLKLSHATLFAQHESTSLLRSFVHKPLKEVEDWPVVPSSRVV